MLKIFSSLCATAASVHAGAGTLSFFGASDTHLGHDVGNVTSLELNKLTIATMNGLANNASWPTSLGGGIVQTPVGVIITGDLVDDGYTEFNQWSNWTNLYGLFGNDGLLAYPVMEGKGNHDGGNSTGPDEHFVAAEIIARNQLRANNRASNITGVSKSGIHYSFLWSVSDTCKVHIVMMNLYGGTTCEGCSPDNCFYGAPCYKGFVYPEDSYGFLQDVLINVVNNSGEPVFVTQHYGMDSYSSSWYSASERYDLYNTLAPYNTLGIFVGHTHVAAKYTINASGEVPDGQPGIDVYNIPSTQKEDNDGNPLPSEFMAVELSVDNANNGMFRIAQRVGDAWGEVLSMKNFTCPRASTTTGPDMRLLTNRNSRR